MIIRRHSPRRQRGAILIISLVFLLLLTVLGFAAMKSSILQERMAGNSADYNVAFQAAEYGLKQAEAILGGVVPLPTFGSVPGYAQMMIAPVSSLQYWDTFNWSGNAVQYQVPGTSSSAFVVIEQMEPESLSALANNGSVAVGNIPFGSSSVVYRITSRGVGPGNSMPVILQETYGRAQ